MCRGKVSIEIQTSFQQSPQTYTVCPLSATLMQPLLPASRVGTTIINGRHHLLLPNGDQYNSVKTQNLWRNKVPSGTTALVNPSPSSLMCYMLDDGPPGHQLEHPGWSSWMTASLTAQVGAGITQGRRK